MLDVQQLQNNIDLQTRNGRKQVYIPVSTMKELGVTYKTSDERVFVDVAYLEKLINIYKKYSFKNSLKVDVSNTTQQTKLLNTQQVEELER